MKVSLFRELGRVLDSGDRAILCAVSHGQVTVDGYTLRPTDDMRWTREVLAGRLARCHGRQARLFAASPRCRTPTPRAVTT